MRPAATAATARARRISLPARLCPSSASSGHDRGGRVAGRVLAEQRQMQVVVRAEEPAHAHRLAPDRLQPVLDIPIPELQLQVRAHVAASILDHRQSVIELLANDDDLALLDDAGLLARDVRHRGPELGVVEVDRA